MNNRFVSINAEIVSKPNLPVALTIATSDSGCGAGIQADLLTFSRLQAYGVTAQAALTAQNPDGVSAVHELPTEFLQAQLDQLAAYFPIAALKTGMLFSAPLIETATRFIEQNEIPAVVDPVMIATSGARLLREDAAQQLRERLLPAATLITPNLDEAAALLGQRPDSLDAMKDAARELLRKFGSAVLLKGGHLPGDELVDIFLERDGTCETITCRRMTGVNTHGSGCTLSAAITAVLARGAPLKEAVQQGHAYLQRSLRHPLHVAGTAFINHG
ncbi:MAG: bifunctional hydroxymethylpyrimidine kinase/phosphomethylpyrimidine kinase [Puniceicoccales bacterium]